MESTIKYKKIFFNLLKEDITNSVAVGGVAGFNPEGDINSSDFYAPGDARIPKSIFGGVLTRAGIRKKRKKRKKRKHSRKKRK